MVGGEEEEEERKVEQEEKKKELPPLDAGVHDPAIPPGQHGLCDASLPASARAAAAVCASSVR